MKTKFLILLSFFFLFSCAVKPLKNNELQESNVDFIIAFGSCNKQNKTNILWKEIIKNEPNLWIWGGDNIYADTYDMTKLKKDYSTLLNNKGYQNLVKNTPIMATWDDHDYGVNDIGYEFNKKKESQQLFLDFLNVEANSERRKQEGIYHSKIIKTTKGTIKVIVLDTRYFRSKLTKSKIKGKRYIPDTSENSTILGEKQWNWLQKELSNSKANFNVIVSSIQFLSAEHGFEKWANFPYEVDKLKNTLVNSKAKNVVLLSGDRHISEFSKTYITGISYPLIDFTSSGLTHAYSNFSGEPNALRIQDVVSEISFGLLKFNFENNSITMQMRGKNNILQQELIQVYN